MQQLEVIQNQQKHENMHKSYERKITPWVRPTLPLEMRKKTSNNKPEKNAISVIKYLVKIYL